MKKAARRGGIGPRGKRQAIVGEKLIRLSDGEARLHEELACGHFVPGEYDKNGDSVSSGGMLVKSRICRQCLDKAPAGPPGEIVDFE